MVYSYNISWRALSVLVLFPRTCFHPKKNRRIRWGDNSMWDRSTLILFILQWNVANQVASEESIIMCSMRRE
jgi:hypothetical protein